jgi:hypothetical protein
MYAGGWFRHAGCCGRPVCIAKGIRFFIAGLAIKVVTDWSRLRVLSRTVACFADVAGRVGACSESVPTWIGDRR